MSVIVKRVRKLNIILKTIRFNAKLSFFLIQTFVLLCVNLRLKRFHYSRRCDFLEVQYTKNLLLVKKCQISTVLVFEKDPTYLIQCPKLWRCHTYRLHSSNDDIGYLQHTQKFVKFTTPAHLMVATASMQIVLQWTTTRTVVILSC